MTGTSNSRETESRHRVQWPVEVVLILALLVAGMWFGVQVRRIWLRSSFTDFALVWTAARHFSGGAALYDVEGLRAHPFGSFYKYPPFVGVFLAPFASMRTFVRDIASASRPTTFGREAWAVDPLTRKVYVRSVTDTLPAAEAELLRRAVLNETDDVDAQDLSSDGRRVYDLLRATGVREVDAALKQLPAAMQERLDAMSPLRYLHDVRAPLIVIGHDQDDLVIPVDESRRLRDALIGRRGVEYTEFAMFEHADPTKRHLSPLRMVQQMVKFYRHIYPMFRLAS